MADTQTGKIIKALSGFYYVKTEDQTVECRARGKLRREDASPLVGDTVSFSVQNGKGMVEAVLPRRNCFVRPAVSNLDALVIFASESIPVTEPFLIDRVAAIAGSQNVPVILCVNKSDLHSGQSLAGIYRRAGFDVVITSAETGQGIDTLHDLISGKTVAFTGNSGVGKSSVLNCLCPRLGLKTADVSEKLGRGRHTTRHVELYPIDERTYVMDTPGFSSFDAEKMALVDKEHLQYAFPDFAPYLGKCQFRDCAHLKEPGCAVLAALEEGRVEKNRYESYARLYEQARQIKVWEQKRPE